MFAELYRANSFKVTPKIPQWAPRLHVEQLNIVLSTIGVYSGAAPIGNIRTIPVRRGQERE